MSRKTTDEQMISDLIKSLKEEFARWSEIEENGTSDPFCPDGVNKVIDILKELNEHYEFVEDSDDAIEIESCGGQVYSAGNGFGFVSGNREYVIDGNSPILKEFVEKYLGGFDEFNAYVSTLTEGKDYRVL